MQKMIKLFFIAVIFLSAMGAVSASDANLTDMDSSDDILSVAYCDDGEISQQKLSDNSTDFLKEDNSSQTVKSAPIISIKSTSVKTKDTLSIYLTDNHGNALKFRNLTVTVNKKTILLKTNSRGIANLNINLPANTHKLTVSFAGGDEFDPQLRTFNIRVSKLSTRINHFTNFVLNKHYYYAYLVDMRGNPVFAKKVTLKLNGKTYSRTTNKNGRIAIKISSPQYAIYSIFYKFNGDAFYSPTSKKVNFYVNHYTSLNLVNSKLLKNGYLRVCLKDSSISVANQNIKIKIGNKIFNKKTNSDGMVVFRPQMDAKKYSVVVTFKQYYVSKIMNCYEGNVKNPLKEVIPLKGGLPDIDVMPVNYVWADESGTYTLTKAQYREVLTRDSYCLFLHNKLPKYTFFKTKNHPNTCYLIKREKWNVIEKEINRILVYANKYNYWPSQVTVSLRGKSYTYYEVRDVQDTLYTCGPTACSMCSHILKNYLPEGYIATHSGTTRADGTACSGMLRTLNGNNFNCTYFYRNTYAYALKELLKGGCAVVFHTKNHYVALLDISPNGRYVLVSNSLGTYNNIASKWISVSYLKTKYYKNYDDGLIVRLNYNLPKSVVDEVNSYYYSMSPNWNCHNTREVVS